VKKTQDVCTQRSLATSKSPKWHTCGACRWVEGSRQLEHYRTKIPV